MPNLSGSYGIDHAFTADPTPDPERATLLTRIRGGCIDLGAVAMQPIVLASLATAGVRSFGEMPTPALRRVAAEMPYWVDHSEALGLAHARFAAAGVGDVA